MVRIPDAPEGAEITSKPETVVEPFEEPVDDGMEDLQYPESKDVYSFANEAPDVAAKNIDRSQLFDITPDSYVDLKPELEQEADSIERPEIAPSVNRYMAQSTQHASLVKDDVENLNYIERQARFIWQHVADIPTIQRQIVDLNNKAMDNPEGLTEEEIQNLEDLNFDMSELGQQDYGIEGPIEQLPGQVLGVVSEIARSVYDNKELVATTTGIGTGAGALVTLGIPVPGARVVGASAGAVKGFVAGVTVAGFVDGYQMMRGSLYNELSHATDDQGQPLELSREMKTNVSHGVALVSGVATAFVGRALTKNNPFLKKFMSPKLAAKIVSNPALRARLDVVGYIAKAAMTGGGAGAITEFARIVGEEFAKSDGSEASILNILTTATNKESLGRMVKTGMISAGAAGTIAGVAGVASFKTNKQRYIDINKKIAAELGDNTMVLHEDGTYTIEPKVKPTRKSDVPPEIPSFRNDSIKQSTKVLNAQDAFTNMGDAAVSTNLKNYSPAEMGAFKKMMFSTVGYTENVWMHIEDLRKFSDSPEKAAAVKKIIDPSGTLNSELNAPVPLTPEQFLDVVEEFPEFSEFMRVNPEGPNPREAKNYVERLNESRDKGQEILATLGVDEVMTPEQQVQLDVALEPSQQAKEVFSENEYYDKPTFTEPIEGVLSAKEVESFNTAQVDARLAVAESLKIDVDRKFQTSERRILKDVNEKDIQREIKELDRELKVVELFDKSNITETALALKTNHKKKGFSPYAIDPSSLPEDLKEIFLNDPVLKKRKMFVEGGLSIDESASLAGMKSGAELLDVLSKTPSRRDIIKNRDQRKIELKNRIQQAIKPTREIERNKVFTNLTKTHLREMKFMREKKWTSAKAGIKRIALPLPTIEGLNLKARTIVSNTPNLNHRQFMVGERRSQKAAVNHILKNEVEQAFKAKENAAFNTELTKETFNAKTRVAKAERFLKKLKKPELQQELKDAKMLDAANEILDVYRLDLSKRGLSKQGAYEKFVKQQVELGNVDFEIPEKFNDVRESATELTVDQYLAITDRLKSLVHQAKMKNKLYGKFRQKEVIQTEEAIVSKASKLLEDHPDYNPKKAEIVPEKSLSITERWKNTVDLGFSAVTNLKNIATTLDQEKLGGFNYEILAQPIVDARTAKRTEAASVVNHVKNVTSKYGAKKFNDAFNDFRFIKEFKDFSHLGNGYITKTDLMVMQAYLGDPQGLERISNFVNNKTGEKLTAETAQQILNRELDESDVALVQNLLLNTFKSFEKAASELHLRTTGQEPRMIKGVPIKHRGKGLPGGYFPLKYQMISDDMKIDKFIKSTEKKVSMMSGLEDGKLYGQLKAAEMTEQGRFEERTGSTRPLDLNFNNFFNAIEEHLHDIHFRETGIDTLKLLKNPIYAKNIKSTVGVKNYKIMVNSVIETVGKTNERNANYFSDEWRFTNDIIRKAESGHAIATLGLNLSSIAMQPLSFTAASLRMGPTGSKYLLKSAGNVAGNLHMLHEFVKTAEELNPDIIFQKDAIDDTLVQSSYDFIPRTQTFLKKHRGSAKVFSSIKEAQKFTTNFAMSGLSEADKVIKIITTLGSAEQFFAGDVENFPMSRLNKMTEAEKIKAVKRYVKQVADLALTTSATEDKAVLEKLAHTKLFTKYWTDSRSQLNTYMAEGRKVKWNTKEAIKQFKNKDYSKAKESAYHASGGLATLVIAASVARLYQDLLRGEETPFDEITEIKSVEDFQEFGKKTALYMAGSVPNNFVELTPAARDVKFAYSSKSRRDYKNVQLPLMKVMSDLTTGISGLADVLSISLGGEAELSGVELKAMLFSGSYLTGGYPINGMYKFKKFLESEAFLDSVDYVSSESKRLNDSINSFVDKFESDPKSKDLIEDLKLIQEEVLSQYDADVENIIPEDTKEIIKEALSEGEWTTLDPETGAAGIYQFTEQRWSEIKEFNPDLGLTDNGRVSKDSKQQEKAMQWSIQDNTRGLIAYGIPVSNETLFGAHKFGFDNYIAIHEANKNEKLTKVLGKEVKDDPLFKDFKTVRSVKDYISNNVQ